MLRPEAPKTAPTALRVPVAVNEATDTLPAVETEAAVKAPLEETPPLPIIAVTALNVPVNVR